MERIRRLLLMPSLAQWRRWSLPSKLTAVGVFLSTVSLLVTLPSLGLRVPNANSPEVLISEITGNIEKRGNEIKDIQEVQYQFRFSPDLSSQKGVARALEEFNEYVYRTTTPLDVGAVHRLMKQYGPLELRGRFGELLNQVKQASLELSMFLIDLERSGRPTSKEELEQWYSKYSEFLTQVSESQARLHGFIGGLAPTDFGY